MDKKMEAKMETLDKKMETLDGKMETILDLLINAKAPEKANQLLDKVVIVPNQAKLETS